MKKGISLILMFILVFSVNVFAGSDSRSSEPINIEIFDTKTETYNSNSVTTVNLMFGNDDIISDVPAFILDGRTLVPIRFITDTLGADISWNQELRQAIVVKDGKEIKLTMDSDKAIVDGKVVNLPSGVPAKLVKYEGISRTMVPFRFVSEQLGMEIKWIADTYTATIDYPHSSINSIEYKTIGDSPSIVLKGDKRFNFSPMYLQSFKLGASDKLIIDIPNADLGNRDVFSENIYANGIVSMRASQFQSSPRDIVRVTVDLEAASNYETVYNEQTNELYINFVNKIADIQVDSNAQAVVIETSKTPIFNVEDLGDRVVVDVLNAKIDNMNFQDIPVNGEIVKQVRYSQFDAGYEGYDKVTRVVFDLQAGKNLTNNMFVSAVNDNIVVYMTNDPMNQLNYEYASLSESTFILDLDSADKSTVIQDTVNRILTITVDKDKIDLLDDIKMDMNDGIIKYIEIDGKTNSGKYIVKIKYDSDTEAKILEGNTSSKQVKIAFAGEGQTVINSLYASKLIVVDAGHGGKDPGASVKGVKEKDLNLDTALKLRDLLEEVGFKVYLTRSDDTYVGLYERSNIANALNADVFLSIHHNATSNSKAYGVLTLYDGRGVIPGKTEFTKIIQKNMVNTLETKDMGLMNKPQYVVVGTTAMPSALAELGFLTNDYERELLTNSWYRQKCAQALLNGIKEFVDTYK